MISEATVARSASGPMPDPADYLAAELPDHDARPDASIEALPAGKVLGSVEARFHTDRAVDYLASVREEAPIFTELGIAHPGHLLRSANLILAANVRLGPWIHTGSEVRHLGVVTDGQLVATHGRVVETFERKGHQFVRLDLLVLADEAPVMHIDHVAIFRPRQLAG